MQDEEDGSEAGSSEGVLRGCSLSGGRRRSQLSEVPFPELPVHPIPGHLPRSPLTNIPHYMV